MLFIFNIFLEQFGTFGQNDWNPNLYKTLEYEFTCD